MPRLDFSLEAEAPGSRARAARFRTLHGEVHTPVFMPVGTRATVKSQTVESLREAGSRVLLANTYHLMLRPGPAVFERFGGIHRFMNWDGPVLTDSGGFQIFSLPHSREMTEAGARFQSYIDGSMHLLSPEKSISVQRSIGSDIMMVLDQCIPSTAGHAQALEAMELTHRWAERSLTARGDSSQALFGIAQGACFRDLRKQSVETLAALPFDGFAIGGLAVGETKAEREDFTEWTAELLPRDLPRYLMGVGTPLDILEAVHRGVDMFDCILPSALAQRGVAFTSLGKLQLRRGVYKLSEDALDPACPCSTCRSFSRAYLHHLNKCDEPLGWTLLASHNLSFYHRMMAEMREHIQAGAFAEYHRRAREALARTDDVNPPSHPRPARDSAVIKGAQLGDYEVHEAKAGFSSIRHVSSGEIMHSVSDPEDEAHRLYVEQTRLAERLREADREASPLVIWDVGLGAATNAMAAIRCYEGLREGLKAELENTGLRPLVVVSFERDLDPLKLALKHPSRFRHLRHGAPHRLLEHGSWEHPGGGLRWELRRGDFRTELEVAPSPELIFYDPFSPKTDAPLWTPELFERVRARCGSDRPAQLATYSCSTAVRAALLSAGFFVAPGAPSGPKAETTLAFTDIRSAGKPLLDRRWLERWNRSGAKFPPALPADQQPAFTALIQGHPQFLDHSPSA